MHQITITIAGVTGSGKTAIAQLISEALFARGFSISELPEDLRSPGFLCVREPDQLEKCLAMVAEKSVVAIKETNLARERA